MNEKAKSTGKRVVYIIGIIIGILFLLVGVICAADESLRGIGIGFIIAALFLIVLCFSANKKEAKSGKVYSEIAKTKQDAEGAQISKSEKKAIAKQEEEKWTEIFGKAFAVNVQDEKIMLSQKVYDWDSLRGAEIEMDENTITTTKTTGNAKTKKKASIGKAAVGGVLAGPVGAVIGAMNGTETTTGKSTSVTKSVDYCKSLNLRVKLNSVETPSISVPFIVLKTSKDSAVFKSTYEKCLKSYEIIQTIIDQRETE